MVAVRAPCGGRGLRWTVVPFTYNVRDGRCLELGLRCSVV